MNPRLVGAMRVLAALDGTPMSRPKREARRVVQRLCRHCQRQILIVAGSASNWAVLERREPDGGIVIVNGIARERGDVHNEGFTHWEFHRCRP